MAGRCEITGKRSGHGHNVSHSKRRTNRTFDVNLQNATLMIDGRPKQVRVATSTLRTLRKQLAAGKKVVTKLGVVG